MTPRISSRLASKTILPRPQLYTRLAIPIHARRNFADEKSYADRAIQHDPGQDGEPKGPNMDQAPHVSEEAAAMSKIKGEQGPEIEEHGTPVQEVAKGDKDVEKHLPKVMKDQLKHDRFNNPSGSRSYSTLVRRQTRFGAASSRSFSSSTRRQLDVQREYDLSQRASWQPPLTRSDKHLSAADEILDDGIIEYEEDDEELERPGHKYAVPAKPLPPQNRLHDRYDTVVDQVTKLIMKHGKLARAQTNMSIMFSHLATSPPPRPSTNHPVLLNSFPPSALPLNPHLYLTIAIDSVAPLIKINVLKGAAGGGQSLPVPEPLPLRQRRRMAVGWILDQVEKKKGGTSPFPKRLAEECIAIIEGRSAVWERRTIVHTQGIRARSNITGPRVVKKKKSSK